MRLRFFQTPKPKKFSFHTRYYNPNKLTNETKVEKGMFANYRNRKGKFDAPDFEENNEGVVQKGSNFTLKMFTYIALAALAVFSFLYFKYGWILSVSILALLLAFSKRK